MNLYFVATKKFKEDTTVSIHRSYVAQRKELANLRREWKGNPEAPDIWVFEESFDLNAGGIIKALEFGQTIRDMQYEDGEVINGQMDKCPECGSELITNYSTVKCSRCLWWEGV